MTCAKHWENNAAGEKMVYEKTKAAGQAVGINRGIPMHSGISSRTEQGMCEYKA